MRKHRFQIGSKVGSRRNSYNISILRPIGDNAAWSGGTTFTLVNDVVNYPVIIAPSDTTFAAAVSGIDDNVTAKWFIGGLNNGPAEFYKIEVYIQTTLKSGDVCTGTIVIGGVSTALTNTAVGLGKWTATTIYGNWTIRDFMSQTADYTNGPYVSQTPGVNSKDTDVFNVQVWLYGK